MVSFVYDVSVGKDFLSTPPSYTSFQKHLERERERERVAPCSTFISHSVNNLFILPSSVTIICLQLRIATANPPLSTYVYLCFCSSLRLLRITIQNLEIL